MSKATIHLINLMAYSSSFRVIINSLTQTRPERCPYILDTIDMASPTPVNLSQYKA